MSQPKRRRADPASLGERDRAILQRADLVVGVDEVGRGSLAGPVVICAAGFDRVPDNPMVRDSKKLTARRRRETAAWLRAVCARWVIVEVWPEVIDRANILEATRLAMLSGVRAIVGPGSEVVVDHVEIGDPGCPVQSFKKADALYFSVAAASILAKVHRDRLMVDLSADGDRWGWSRNMGYGTVEHRRAIDRHGRSYLHRQSFRASPVYNECRRPEASGETHI